MNRPLAPGDFAEFYRAAHDVSPFPWQVMLAERVAVGAWPSCIDLPTASGKTACIDIAIFTLACQADRPVKERTAPRRVFFVVDRRIVVDEAFDRASRLARLLSNADNGVLKTVADRLRMLGIGTHSSGEPLVVTRMRGGIARNDGWVRNPAQAAVVTTTVDQIGSRLLFRGYGRSRNVAPIDAALTGNDALIILDEAHCSVPFSQTMRTVQRYRGAAWAERPIGGPFYTVIMSATPPEEIDPGEVFPAPQERDAALASDELRRRILAVKRAELAIARTPPKPRKGEQGLSGDRLSDDALVLDAADRALKLASAGAKRIGIMVNRVATARAVWRQIVAETSNGSGNSGADVVLMTGRMRPLDRDRLVTGWEGVLKAKREPPPVRRPIILVTTQCLEVGADFSFDALITECASLDALRQRFGRLDRLGLLGSARGVILIRPAQVRTADQIAKLWDAGKHDDPVYGNALAATWNWLTERAEDPEQSGVGPWIDMGIEGLEAHLPPRGAARRDLLTRLSAPALDAPVMLPAHVDLLAQTSPRPAPDPDVSLYLHGPERGEPEVSVVFRRDLDANRDFDDSPDPDHPWVHTVSLLPPTTPEAFPVPLRLVRHWLAAGRADPLALHDIEGPLPVTEDPARAGVRFVVLWRGRDHSLATSDPTDVRPGDIVVIPSWYGVPEAFGDVLPDERGWHNIDVAEAAFQKARDRAVLRVYPGVLEAWAKHPAVQALIEWGKVPDRESDREDLEERLAAVASADDSDSADMPPLPVWLRTAARLLAPACEVAPHPCGGYVLSSRQRLGESIPDFDLFADADDLASDAERSVTLTDHLRDVAELARAVASRCLPAELVEPVVRAANLHDLGKADPRFQQLLLGGSELAALAEPSLLAKSRTVPTSKRARQRARELCRLPRGFRHELLSVQLAERYVDLPEDSLHRDLTLHLIAAHHGFNRPFPAVALDPEPREIELALNGRNVFVSAEQRRGWIAPHSLDSGIAERYWRASHQLGWWGLAYLEAILRLADWAASELEAIASREELETPVHAGA